MKNLSKLSYGKSVCIACPRRVGMRLVTDSVRQYGAAIPFIVKASKIQTMKIRIKKGTSKRAKWIFSDKGRLFFVQFCSQRATSHANRTVVQDEDRGWAGATADRATRRWEVSPFAINHLGMRKIGIIGI